MQTKVLDKETSNTVLASVASIRRESHESASSNVKKAKETQKEDFDQCYLSTSEIKVEILSYYTTAEENM